jgi:hypothetical protein
VVRDEIVEELELITSGRLQPVRNVSMQGSPVSWR